MGSRIGSNLQYEGFKYTLDTTDISGGPTVSSYKTLESMDDLGCLKASRRGNPMVLS